MNIYERLKKINIDKVLYEMQKAKDNKIGKKRVMLENIPLKLLSLRLQTFLEDGIKCYNCNLEASFFAVERDLISAQKDPENKYHLNLWGINEEGEEVLFTHDHVLARALGGKNDRTNTKTMCTKCNFEKSLKEQEILKEQRNLI